MAQIGINYSGKISIGGKTYEFNNEREIAGVDAACHAEYRFSHPYCGSYPPAFDQAETTGQIRRSYDGRAWRWYVA